MANPTWVTEENIKFDGTLTDVAIFDVTGDDRTLVEWDNVPVQDQNRLIDLVDLYGGDVPLSTESDAIAGFGLAVGTVGATSTGLNAVAAATAGKATIDLGAAKVGGDPSGLSSAAGTSGYAVANLQPGVVGATNLGLTAPTQGTQTINYGGTALGANPTGLANDATAYTMTVTVDGVAIPVSVVGSAAQTFTTLVAQINADLGVAAVASIVAGNIVITSATYGVASTVLVADGTLLVATTGFVAILAASNGTGATSFTATVTIDGVAYPLSVNPLTVTTFTQLLAYINGVITTNGSAAISGGDLRITSATFGILSKVRITPGTLFPALVGYVGILPPADGGGAARKYSATVVIDGTKVKTVSFNGTAGTTLTNVLSEINTDLGADATAAITGGDIVITSASTGRSSSVAISDSGMLFASLTGYTSIARVDGTGPVTYTASVTITIDGTPTSYPLSVVGSDVQTMDDLATELTTQLVGSDIEAIVQPTEFIFASDPAMGTTAVITVDGGTLFPAVTPITGPIIGRPKAASFLDVLLNTKADNGNSFYSTLPIKVVGAKPAVPPYAKKTLDFVYFDGTEWVYLTDDTPVNP